MRKSYINDFVTKPIKGQEGNWIRTNAEKGYFVVLRFYGPLEGYIDKTWVISDFERI